MPQAVFAEFVHMTAFLFVTIGALSNSPPATARRTNTVKPNVTDDGPHRSASLIARAHHPIGWSLLIPTLPIFAAAGVVTSGCHTTDIGVRGTVADLAEGNRNAPLSEMPCFLLSDSAMDAPCRNASVLATCQVRLEFQAGADLQISRAGQLSWHGPDPRSCSNAP